MPNDLVQARGGAAPAASAAPVTPRASAQPSTAAAPAAAAPAPAGGAGGAIPDEVAQLPPITALLAGEPAAVSLHIPDFEKRPESKALAAGGPALQEAGISFYSALDGKTGVMVNQMFMPPEEVQAADKAGKLLEVAPPWDAVEKAVVSGAPLDHPAFKGMKGANRTGQPATAPAPSPDQGASSQAMNMKVPGAGSAPAQQQARAANMGAGAPSSGPKPGAGRILNSILKPVV